MLASKIKEGCEYAVDDTPRKKVSEDRLHTRSANRVRVLEKGVERWADSAKDSWGDPDGNYRNDGIRVIRMSSVDGMPTTEHIYKPRDFLMPWGEYTDRREHDRIERERREAEREARNRAYVAKMEAAERRLKEIPGLIFIDRYVGRSEGDNIWHVRESGHDFELSPDGVHFVLDRISEIVYEILAEQDTNE